MFVCGETVYVSHEFGDFKNECQVPGSYNQCHVIAYSLWALAI